MHVTEWPVIIGLSGSAGVGKSVTANTLATPGMDYLDNIRPIVFTNVTLAEPIYEIVSIKRHIKGSDPEDVRSRIMHEIHSVLDTTLNKYPSYDDVVELVYDIYHMDAGTIDDPKPRTFMQEVGDMCRDLYEDCFIDAALTRIQKDFTRFRHDYVEILERKELAKEDTSEMVSPVYVALISDVRRTNEVKRMRTRQNSALVRLSASPEVIRQRMYERDGFIMDDKQLVHPTETEANGWPEDFFDFILDTDKLTIEDQALSVYDYVIQNYATGVRVNNG